MEAGGAKGLERLSPWRQGNHSAAAAWIVRLGKCERLSSLRADSLRSSTDWCCLGSHTHQHVINSESDWQGLKGRLVFRSCHTLPRLPIPFSIMMLLTLFLGLQPSYPALRHSSFVRYLDHQGSGRCVSPSLRVHSLSFSFCLSLSLTLLSSYWFSTSKTTNIYLTLASDKSLC